MAQGRQTSLSAAGDAAPGSAVLLLAGLTLAWGLNWPMMKLVLGELPVWSFRSLCLLFGGGSLLILALLWRQKLRVPASEIPWLLLCCLFNVIGWHLLTGYGLTLLAAGRAAIAAFTMPVWAALLSSLFLGERMTVWKLLGLGLGMLGIAVLIGPELKNLESAPLGALLMTGAAFSWAAGIVAVKARRWSISPTVQVGWQLLIGALPITIGALAFEGRPNPATLSATAWAALAYVLVIAMIFCHWAWFRIMHTLPAAVAAISTLAIPIVGVFSSAMILDEAVGLRELVALALVCAALLAVLLAPALRMRMAR